VSAILTRLLQGLAYLLAFLPFKAQSLLVVTLGKALYALDRKGRGILLRNTALVYEVAPHSSFARLFAHQVYRSQIRCGLEAFKALLRPDTIEIRGMDEFKARVRELETCGPVIACTAHLGAWELAGFCCHKASALGFVALAKESRLSALTNLLTWLRGKFCVKVLYVGKKTIVRDVLLALKSHMVGFVADQKPQARQGILVSFLGQPTELVSGPEKFALKASASVVALYVVRTGDGQYTVISDVILHRAAEAMVSDGVISKRLAESMERAIRLYPEQWAWNYKRWRA
jgi:KDO2-lipid IV(A) lauroyltransferase